MNDSYASSAASLPPAIAAGLLLFVLAVDGMGQVVTEVTPSGGTQGTQLTISITGLPAGKVKAWLAPLGSTSQQGRQKLKVEPFAGGELSATIKKVKPGLDPGVFDLWVKPKGLDPIRAPGVFELIAPDVQSVEPTPLVAGEPCTIHGNAFGSAKPTVHFGGLKAKVDSWDDGTIVCDVPKGLGNGCVTVRVSNTLGEDALEACPGPAGGKSVAIRRFEFPADQSEPEWTLFDDGRSVLRVLSGANTVLVCLAADGSIAWQTELKGQFHLRRSLDGDLWIHGFDQLAGGVVGKLDANSGAPLWATSNGYFGSVAVDPNGPAVERLPLRSENNNVIGIGEVEADGSIAWQAFAISNNHPPKILELGDGTRLAYGVGLARFDQTHALYSNQVLGAGTRHAFECSGDRIALIGTLGSNTLWTAKLDPSGQLSDQRAFSAAGLTVDGGSELADDGSGGRFVALQGFTATYLLHVDGQGDVQWLRHLESPQAYLVRKLVPRVGGGVFAVASRFDQSEVWVVALDAQGGLEWEHHGTVLPGFYLLQLDAARTASGELLVFGPSWVDRIPDAGPGPVVRTQWPSAIWDAPRRLSDGRFILSGWSGISSTLVAALTPEGSVARSVELAVPTSVFPLLHFGTHGLIRVSGRGHGLDADVVFGDIDGQPAVGACSAPAPYQTVELAVSGGVSKSLADATEITPSVQLMPYPYLVQFPPASPSTPVSLAAFLATGNLVSDCQQP